MNAKPGDDDFLFFFNWLQKKGKKREYFPHPGRPVLFPESDIILFLFIIYIFVFSIH